MDTAINLLDDEEFMTFQEDSLSRLFDGCADLNMPETFDFCQSNKDTTFGIDSENLMQTWINAENVQSDHDYASCPPSDSSDTTSCDMSAQMSPTTLSDSGISSASPYSRSPTSDYTRNSPDQFLLEADSPKENLSDDNSEARLSLLDDLQFDFSDIDMEKVANNFPMAGDDILDSCLRQINDTTSDNVCIQLDDNFFSQKNVTKKPNCTKTNFKSTSSANSRMQSTISPHAVSVQEILKEKSTSTTTFRCTLPNFKPLVLSEEEKRLLSEENASLPTDLPLTKNEERILKKVRRKIRNKKSAMESRKRRKDYLGGLENRVSQCTFQNHELVKKVKDLESENATLISQLRRLQEIVKATSNKTTQATTCVMVLLLSFGLFLAPSYGPFSINKKEMTELEVSDAISESHKSRRVLELPEPSPKRPRLDIPDMDVPIIDVQIKQESREGSFVGLDQSIEKVELGMKSYHETDIIHNDDLQLPIKKENNSSNNASKTEDNMILHNGPINPKMEDDGLRGSEWYSERPNSPVGLAPKSLQPLDDLHPPDSNLLVPAINHQKAKMKIVHVSRIDEM